MNLDEVKKYLILFQTSKDENAFKILLKNYEKLLLYFVNKYSYLTLSKDELKAAALRGFYSGLLKYDYENNTMQPFTTYIGNSIINEIIMENRKLKRKREFLLLDESIKNENNNMESYINNLVGMNEEDVFRMATEKYQSEIIEEMLKSLTPKQREIIKYRFGVCGYPEKKLAELATLFNCSIQFVSSCEHSALKKMRKLYRSKYPDLNDII